MSCFYYLPNLPYFLFCLLKYINLKAFGNYPSSRLEMNQVALTSSRFSDVQHTRTPELLTAKQVDDYLTNPIAKRMAFSFNNWNRRPKVESQKWDEARWSQQVFWIITIFVFQDIDRIVVIQYQCKARTWIFMNFDVNLNIAGVSGQVEARQAAEVEVRRWKT